MTDIFEQERDRSYKASRAPFTITPHNINAIDPLPRRIFVGGGGDITLRGVDSNSDVVYKNVGDGVYLFIRPEFIRVTGTSATYIIGE